MRIIFGKNAKTIFLKIITGFVVFITVDIISAFLAHPLALIEYLILAIVESVVFIFVLRDTKTVLRLLVITLSVMFVISVSYISIKSVFRNNSVYRNVDSGKTDMFSGKTVCLVVPHQDDDINILGGVIDEYIRYGSKVYVVFSTDGNFYGIGDERKIEAYNVADAYGIPRENFIFMEYPDSGKYVTENHFYNETESAVRKQFCDELYGIIMSIKPDVVFCDDYDRHVDHKAISLLFEEVLRSILKDNPDYKPIVYKGFAYSTGYYADTEFDSYYTTNISKTKNPYNTPYMQETNVYLWKDRVRLPVNSDTLSRSIYTSKTYKICGLYGTQDMQYRSVGFIRGDKVFWQRRTDSVLYDSEVEATSGNADVLTDFKLIDSHMIITDYPPFEGVWVPATTDTEKTISISLNHPKDITYISIYDNPSLTDNILDARIIVNGNYLLNTGALQQNGSENRFEINQENVNAIDIQIISREGENAGLTEIEAFSTTAPVNESKFIKLEDSDDNFVYDYHVNHDGNAVFNKVLPLSSTILI